LQDAFTSHAVIKMSQYVVPEAETFKLLGEKDPIVKKPKDNALHPVSHIKSRVTFTVMTDNVTLPVYGIPAELMDHIRHAESLYKKI